MRNRMRALGPTALNALGVLGLQVLSLIALDPREFGTFSIPYLLFAFASSVTFSVICEAWIRRSDRADWRDYSAALVTVSGLAGVVALAGSLLLTDLRAYALPITISLVFATYRVGARYFALSTASMRTVWAGDALSLIPLLFAWGWSFFGTVNLSVVLWAWALSSLFSALGSKLPRVSPLALVRWYRGHRASVKVLLGDSILMDASSIGTPYLILPVLGVSSFGIYRAVSNVAAPVRLLLNPIRPIIGGKPVPFHRQRKVLFVLAGSAIALGAGAFVVLFIIGAAGWSLGTLTALTPFALPTAIFVAANFIGHYFYIAARGNLPGKRIFTGRIVQTVTGVLIPLSGALLWGLNGAIWAYAGATVLSSICWATLVITTRRNPGLERVDTAT